MLRRLVGDAERFAAEVWGRQPLIHHAGRVDDLFGPEVVDRLLADHGVRAPFVRVAKDGKTLPDKVFTESGGVGAMIADQVSDDKLHAQFSAGATIVLQGLHRLWPPLTAFAQQLSADLGHPVQVNSYITPPGNRGFADHYDVHDVFVVQISGSKRWQVRQPVLTAPLRSQPWTDHKEQVVEAAAAPPLLEATLRPGDCLYLPRGYLHSATALGATSIHLTIGIHPWTVRHVLERLSSLALAEVTTDENARASLPIGFDAEVGGADLEAALATARSALVSAIERIDAHDVATALAADHRSSQRAEPLAVLAQHAAIGSLRPADRLRPRRHLAASWAAAGDDAVRLTTRAGHIVLTRAEAELVRPLLDAQAGTRAAGSSVDGMAASTGEQPASIRAEQLGLGLAGRLLGAGVFVPA